MSEEGDIIMKSIFLQLGDVFKITNSTNDIYNNQSYYVEYIDSHKIKTIHVDSLDRIDFDITTDLRLTEKDSDKIIDGNVDLLFRNHYEGFALQHKLTPTTWIRIVFDNGEISGEITELEQDMITIELSNTKEKIYINFNYNGIPENLSIKQIKIINQPDEYEEESQEDLNIEVIGNVEDIVQLLDVDVSKYRYDIDTQKNDLLNSMLSQLSSSDKTYDNLNNIHLNIERFQQLRKQFSTFDEYENIVDSINKGPLWKPLIHNLDNFKQYLSWIIPVTSTIKKVYGIKEDELEEFTFILNHSLDIDKPLEEIIQIFKSETSNQKSFRYIQYLQNLYNYFTPFENLDTINSLLLTKIPIHNYTSVLIDNTTINQTEFFESNVIKTIPLPKGEFYNKVESNIFIRDVYLPEDKILDAYQLTEGKMFANRVSVPNTINTLNITGLLVLPEPIIEYSRVQLPGTNILDKTHLSHLFIDYSYILNTVIKKNIYDINNKNINNDFSYKNFIKKNQLNYFKPSISGNYVEFLENIIPTSKNIFNLVKPYIVGKLSLINIIHFLEPYLIYPDDVTFTFYSRNIIPFIEDKIREFGTDVMSKKNVFDSLFNVISRLNERNPKNSLKITMNFPKQELCDMYEIKETNKHPSNDELLFKMTISDFKNTYNYGIVQSNIHLLIDSKMNEFIEDQEEKEKENPCEELKEEECLSREKCMDDENKCNSISNIAKNITKQNLNKVLSEFDKRFAITERQLEEYIHKEYQYYSSILQKVIHIEYYIYFGKYDIMKYKLGEEASREMKYDREFIQSPYIQLRDVILGISDLNTRYDKIIQFKEKYTYDAFNNTNVNKTDDHYWFYCIKTNTKILPTFIYELAYTFINDRSKYQNKLDYIIQTQGENGDDGESYVDKYSGYVIQKKLLDTAEGYENGFKVVTREYLEEEGEEEEKVLDTGKPIEIDRPYMKYEKYKLIIKTINELCHSLNNIRLDNETKNDFIVNIVYQQMNKFPNEKKYKEIIKRNREKKPDLKSVDYEVYINRNLLYLTIASFLISLQTNIPNIILNEKCCTMDAYPTNPDGSKDSIKFISTISYNLTKRKEQPWLSVIKIDGSRMKLDELETEIFKAITKIMDNPDSLVIIEQRKQLKIDVLSNRLESRMDATEFIPKIYKISNWKQFLPPLFDINIKTHVNDVSEEFKKSLLRKLKNGDITQYDNINILEGKSIIFSLLVQQEIQDVINSEELKLKSLSNQVYLENSCCLALNNNKRFIDYFIKEKPIIHNYLENIRNNSLRLEDIRFMTFSPFLFINKNSKLKYPPLTKEFTEETIYMAFISYCNFEKPKPIPDDFKHLCKCTEGKPDSQLFDLNDSIYEKVEKLKRIGKLYTNSDLIRLLQRVGHDNIIRVHISEEKIIQPLENMRKLLITDVHELPHKQLDEDIDKVLSREHPLMKSNYMLQFLNHWINTVDKKSKVDKTERDKINDDILYVNEELIKYIHSFLTKKAKKIDKEINDFFDTIFDWKKTSFNFSNLITFIKNYTFKISKVFPNMLATNFLQNGIESPLFKGIVNKYQGLSDRDINSIKDDTIKYYQRFISLNELINDENKGYIVLILNKIQENEYCNKLIHLMNETPIFSQIKDRIFDNEITLSLFSFYFLTIFSTYIKVTLDFVETIDVNPGIKQNIIVVIIHLLVTYMNMMNEDKISIDILYKDVFDKEFKFKEIEKSEMITRLQQMTNEARKADNNMKAHRLGIWGKGLSDKVFKYTKDYDLIDTTVLKKTKQVEQEMRETELLKSILIDNEEEPQQEQNREIDEDEVEHGDADEDDFNDGYEYDEYDEGEEYNDRDRDE